LLHGLLGLGGEAFEVDEVQAIAQAADEGIAHSAVGDAGGLIGAKDGFAASFDALEIDVVGGFGGGLAEGVVGAPEFSKLARISRTSRTGTRTFTLRPSRSSAISM
jgi:hypothetical protein